MHKWDPKQIGEAALLLQSALDKLVTARNILAGQNNEYGPHKAHTVNQIIQNIEHELERL